MELVELVEDRSAYQQFIYEVTHISEMITDDKLMIIVSGWCKFLQNDGVIHKQHTNTIPYYRS